ncbi:MAG TPA: hypothetical protein PK698_06445 [Bacilli bacterium]|nr:hypothetical protein [Bacilli bacterium]
MLENKKIDKEQILLRTQEFLKAKPQMIELFFRFARDISSQKVLKELDLIEAKFFIAFNQKMSEELGCKLDYALGQVLVNKRKDTRIVVGMKKEDKVIQYQLMDSSGMIHGVKKSSIESWLEKI